MRLIDELDVIKIIDKHTTDDGKLDNDISVILEEVKTAFDKKKMIERISREEEYHHERTKLRDSNIRLYSEGAERAFCFARNIVEKGEIE